MNMSRASGIKLQMAVWVFTLLSVLGVLAFALQIGLALLKRYAGIDVPAEWAAVWQ